MVAPPDTAASHLEHISDAWGDRQTPNCQIHRYCKIRKRNLLKVSFNMLYDDEVAFFVSCWTTTCIFIRKNIYDIYNAVFYTFILFISTYIFHLLL